MRLKAVSLIICLSGCAMLPPFPEVNQCAYKPKLGLFVCRDTTTKKIVHIPIADASMEGAQCVSTEDFKSVQDWIQQVQEIAQRRCQ